MGWIFCWHQKKWPVRGVEAENCRPGLQKSNVLRCFDPLASFDWHHIFGGTTHLDCTCWISSGECSTFHSPLKERWFFQLTSLLPDVSFSIFKKIFYITYTYIHYTYIYISSFIHIPKTNEIPPEKGTFWRLCMEKNLFGVWTHHGITWGSGKVPLFPAWPCVRRCLCSGCWTGGHRGHRHPGKEPRERKRVFLGGS